MGTRTETVFTFFCSGQQYILFGLSNKAPKHLYSAILLAAIAAHIRPVGLYWAYFLPAFLFYVSMFFKHGTKTYSLRFAAKHSIFAFVCLMLFAP